MQMQNDRILNEVLPCDTSWILVIQQLIFRDG